ncbi:MAG: UDP-N-acetylmuramate dehydrogenase [Coriobacteriaceae bacterium]|nr:UDP-N-acetylmuramate dehydrogenase [Coriobacteriaceae bacterium]
MASHTTYRIGGPAALFITCISLHDLICVTEILTSEDVDWFILGGGSNLLVSDEGFDGAVVVLDKDSFSFIDVLPNTSTDSETVLLSVGGATPLARLVRQAADRSLAGLECMAGIPGTLGGAISMNAGTADGSIGTLVQSLNVLSASCGCIQYRGSDLNWGYRTVNLPDDEIIYKATIQLHQGDQKAIRSRMQDLLDRRRKTQPLDLPSCGSVFRNPPEDHAARLIESVGLKGATAGGARISDKHANFIVNVDSARAADVCTLIRRAHDEVQEACGIDLRTELRFLGFSHA